jgi:hypothetical protein
MLGHLLSHALISTGSGALRAGPLLSVAIATARSHSTRAGLVRVLDVHAGSAAVSTVSTTCRGPSCPSSSLPRRAPSSTQAASTDSGASVLQIEVELCSSCGLLHVTGHRLAHRSHTSPVSPPPPPRPARPFSLGSLYASCARASRASLKVVPCGLAGCVLCAAGVSLQMAPRSLQSRALQRPLSSISASMRRIYPHSWSCLGSLARPSD